MPTFARVAATVAAIAAADSFLSRNNRTSEMSSSKVDKSKCSINTAYLCRAATVNYWQRRTP